MYKNQLFNLPSLLNKSIASHEGNLTMKTDFFYLNKISVWDAVSVNKMCTNKDSMNTFSFLDLSLVYRWPGYWISHSYLQ